MNKKVLSAILFSALFAGTGTFTSCIDNDEPAGIEELRGAKAELLKAKAAYQLAEEAFKRAMVANQEILNEAARLANEATKIENEKAALELKIKEAKTEAEIQGYLYQKQLKENAIAKLAETFKAEMLRAQADTYKAQTELDAAIKAAELAKLTVDAASQALLDGCLANMSNKQTAMTTAYDEVVKAQKAYRQALLDDAASVSLAMLEAKLAVKKGAVKVKEVAVADAETMLALAKDFDTETWAAQLDSLRADSMATASAIAAAQVDLTALYMGTEYQAAEKAYKEAVEKYGKEIDEASAKWDDSEKEYVSGKMVDASGSESVNGWNKTYGENNDTTLYQKYQLAKSDSTSAMVGKYDFENDKATTTVKEFKIKKYESEPVAEGLQNFLEVFIGTEGLDGYSTSTNKFSYNEFEYTEDEFRADSVKYKEFIAEKPEGTYAEFKTWLTPAHNLSKAFETLHKAENWVDVLSTYATDTNGLAWSQIGLDIERQDSARAQKAFDEAKAQWQILVDAINGKKATAPTDSVVKDKNGLITKSYDIEAIVADYNVTVDSLVSKVAAYNAVIDSIAKCEKKVYETAYDASYDAAYDAKYLKLYEEAVKTNFSSVYATLTPFTNLEELKAQLNDIQKSACETGANGAMKTWLADDSGTPDLTNEELLEENAEAAGVTALSTNTELSAIVNKLSTAENAVKSAGADVDEAWEAVQELHTDYYQKDVLLNTYGQVFAGANLNAYVNAQNENDTIAVGATKYLNAPSADNTGNMDVWNFIAKDFDLKPLQVLGSEIESDTLWLKNAAGKDSVYTSKTSTSSNVVEYNYIKAAGSNISAAELANLSVTELAEASDIKTPLLEKTRIAFGNEFDWNDDDSRLVEVTEEMVKDHMEKTTGAVYSDYGKLGLLMKEKADVEKILAQKDADKLVEPLLEVLEAQLAVLKAEIAANTAKVALVENKAVDAWTAFEVGEAMVEKTKADRDALSAEAEAEIELLEAILDEKQAVLTTATDQLSQLFGNDVIGDYTGALTTDKLIASWEKEVAKAQKAVENAKLAVAEAEKKIELYKAGEYNKAYAIEAAKIDLEAAQEYYEAAVEVYEVAVAEFNAILEALTK